MQNATLACEILYWREGSYQGRGRGGATYRTASTDVSNKTITVPASLEPDQIEAVVQGELALYEPMREVIAGDWSRDRGGEPLSVEITALQGRRSTGGVWSRPDIVSVEVRTFSFVPGQHLEVTTFEIKATNAINVGAVYEALAHRRSATRSYVLAHIPTEKSGDCEQLVPDVAEVARAHGIGLVIAGDPHDYQSWEEREEAKRIESDPEKLDNFLSTQMSENAQKKILRRLR